MGEHSGFDVAALQRHVIEHAWKDDKFRKDLLSNPKAVLSREIAKMDPKASIPDGVDIKVVEETPSTFFLVLPNNPATLTDKMSDDDLADAGIRTIIPNVVDTALNLASGTRRCRCHRTWATLY